MSLIGFLTATEKQVHLGRLHMRSIQWHLKNNWHIPESLDKVILIPKPLHPHLRWWLDEENVLTGQPLHPVKYARQIFTDASKEGWGAHLDGHTARGVWSLPESKLHINHLELKAFFLALKQFQDLCTNKIVLVATDNTTVVSYINKEGGMRSGPLCALLWRILTWCTGKPGDAQGPTHPRPSKCGSRQVIQDGPDHSNRVVPSARGFPGTFQGMASATDRLICYEVQQQAASICVPSTGPPGHGSGCTQSAMGGSGRICGGEVAGHPMRKNHSDYPGVAQHALVLGSGGHVQPDSPEPAQSAQPVDTALQSDPSQKSD